MFPLHFWSVCMAQNNFLKSPLMFLFAIFDRGRAPMYVAWAVGLSSHSLKSYMTLKLRPNVTLDYEMK
jgi:hypothetical protein